jgi:hypothetical protein
MIELFNTIILYILLKLILIVYYLLRSEFNTTGSVKFIRKIQPVVFISRNEKWRNYIDE